MENILPGVVHLEGTMRGKPIELAGDRGLGDGQRVEVAIRAVGERDRREAAIRNTAGALAHMAPEFFEELNEIVRGREEGVVMSGILQGIIRGKSIELESDPGIPDGKLVEVLLRVRLARSAPPSNSEDAGRTTSAGMLVDDEEWDADLEAVLAKRKTSRHREIGG